MIYDGGFFICFLKIYGGLKKASIEIMSVLLTEREDYYKITFQKELHMVPVINTEMRKIMTSKERAQLKAQAMKLDSIFQIGKSSLSPAQIDAIKAALKSRELIKISVLKNCMDDPVELATMIAERTGSQVVQVIGKKIVLYKKNVQKEEKKKRAERIRREKKQISKFRQDKASRKVRGGRTRGGRSQGKRNG